MLYLHFKTWFLSKIRAFVFVTVLSKLEQPEINFLQFLENFGGKVFERKGRGRSDLILILHNEDKVTSFSLRHVA